MSRSAPAHHHHQQSKPAGLLCFTFPFSVSPSTSKPLQPAKSPLQPHIPKRDHGRHRHIPKAKAQQPVQVGMELEGLVTRTTDYGAFIDLGAYGSGLVHISEITSTFVRSVDEHLSKGDSVRVRVVAIEGSRISLSIKQSKYSHLTGYDRVVQLGGDWGHPWNDDGSANFIDLGPRPRQPNAWENDPALFKRWVDPDAVDDKDSKGS